MKLLVPAAAAALIVLMPAAALAAPVVLTATLVGPNEPAGGDADGTGTFRAEADPATGDFCYTLTAENTATPTMAHVHTGAVGVDGPPIANLSVTGKGGDECVAMEPDKIKEVLANPAAFYVNVHTADYPKGAIRGQLTKQ